MTPLQRKEFIDRIQRVLHVPGNYRGGILEMAIVVDYGISEEMLQAACKEMIAALKNCDKIFMNARCNLIKWVDDTDIRKEVSSVGLVQMGRAFADYVPANKNKSLDELLRQLKFFYARSKIIIVLTNGEYVQLDKEAIEAYKKPFLGKKLLLFETKHFL